MSKVSLQARGLDTPLQTLRGTGCSRLFFSSPFKISQEIEFEIIGLDKLVCWHRLFRCVERFDQMGSDDNDKFRTVFLELVASEEGPQNRNVAEQRDFLYVFAHLVVEQTCDGEALAVGHFDNGRYPARCQRRNQVALQLHGITEVKLGNFRRDLHVDPAAAQDSGRELQRHTVWLVFDCDDCAPCGWLGNRYWEFPSRKEIGLFPAQGDQCGFSQDLKQALVLQGVDGKRPGSLLRREIGRGDWHCLIHQLVKTGRLRLSAVK